MHSLLSYHVGLVATQACDRPFGLQRTQLSHKTETLDSGLCFGLAEDAVGLFPWRDRWRWDTGADFYFHPNKFCHITISHTWVHEMLFSQSCARASFPPTRSCVLAPGPEKEQNQAKWCHDWYQDQVQWLVTPYLVPTSHHRDHDPDPICSFWWVSIFEDTPGQLMNILLRSSRKIPVHMLSRAHLHLLSSGVSLLSFSWALRVPKRFATSGAEGSVSSSQVKPLNLSPRALLLPL